MSSGMRSPSAVERAAASSRSAAVRQPCRRRMTYVFMSLPSLVELEYIHHGPGRATRASVELPCFRRRGTCVGSAWPLEKTQALGACDGLHAGAGIELAQERRDVWSTVRRERYSCCAISALRRPSAMSASTSVSRGVRPAAFSRVARRGPRVTPLAPRARSRRDASCAAGRAPSFCSVVSASRNESSSLLSSTRQRRLVRGVGRSHSAAASSHRRRARAHRRRCVSNRNRLGRPASRRQTESRGRRAGCRARGRRRVRARLPASTTPGAVRARRPRPAPRRGRGARQVVRRNADSPASSSAAPAPGSPRRARTSASTTRASWCGQGDSRGSLSRRSAKSAASVHRPRSSAFRAASRGR